MDDLIKDNLTLVRYVLRTYYPTLAGDEDYLQTGVIGLWKAISTYDTSKDIKFNTYASRCIKNEINMELARNNTSKRFLDKDGVCLPLNKQISDAEGASEEWVNNLPNYTVDGNTFYLLQIEEYYNKQSKRDRYVFDRKVEGLPTEVVAKELGVSGQTIRRIWNRIKKEVREIVVS